MSAKELHDWLRFFLYQRRRLREWHFGFFESLYYAAWKASAVIKSGRSFKKWTDEQVSK